jgi:carboxyl-terminal processing protease
MNAAKPALAAGLFAVALVCSPIAAAQDRSRQAGAARDAAAQDRPAIVDGRPVPAVRGIWRSRGYGYLVQIEEKAVKLFHVAGSFCYADPANAYSDLIALYRPLASGALAFSTDPGGTRVVFDRLPAVPAACFDRTRWSAPRMTALVAATFADLYPSFERRGIDWAARTATALAALDEKSDDDALFWTLQIMLAGIEDPHVELKAKVKRQEVELMPGEGTTLARMRQAFGSDVVDGADWVPAYRDGIQSIVLKGKAHAKGKQRLYWGRLGDIGYLNILSMEGLSARDESGDKAVIDAAMDEAAAAFAGAKAVIVDVSYNLGGFDGVSQRIAGRFAATRKLGYTKVAVGARDVEPQEFHVEPSDRPRYLGPVVLVTSDVTVSAGEIFTLLMRALPNVRHVGKTTRGALSDMTEKPLPNGWSLSLPAEIYLDAGGLWYEVWGISPQLEGDVFPADDLTSGHAKRVSYLIELVGKWLPPR